MGAKIHTQETSSPMNSLQLMEETKREKRYDLETQEVHSSFTGRYGRENK